MHKKLILIDLDGTFVRINSFHKWIKFLLIETVKQCNCFITLRLIGIMLLRYTKRISHAQMKYRILKISETTVSRKQIERFVDTLVPYIDQDILALIQRQNTLTLLATAAPILYAKQIQERFGFDYVVATPESQSSPWQETIRNTKAKRVQKFLQAHSLQIKEALFLTDHHDDIPLMHLVYSTYLVNASKQTLKCVHDAGIKLEKSYADI